MIRESSEDDEELMAYDDSDFYKSLLEKWKSQLEGLKYTRGNRLKWDEKLRYRGYFKNGKKHGPGIFKNDVDVLLISEWFKGEPNGLC